MGGGIYDGFGGGGESLREVIARAPNPEDGTVLVNPTTGEIIRTCEEAEKDGAAAFQRGQEFIANGGVLLTTEQLLSGTANDADRPAYADEEDYDR